MGIEAKYQEQLRFFTVVKPEFDAKARVGGALVAEAKIMCTVRAI